MVLSPIVTSSCASSSTNPTFFIEQLDSFHNRCYAISSACPQEHLSVSNTSNYVTIPIYCNESRQRSDIQLHNNSQMFQTNAQNVRQLNSDSVENAAHQQFHFSNNSRSNTQNSRRNALSNIQHLQHQRSSALTNRKFITARRSLAAPNHNLPAYNNCVGRRRTINNVLDQNLPTLQSKSGEWKFANAGIQTMDINERLGAFGGFQVYYNRTSKKRSPLKIISTSFASNANLLSATSTAYHQFSVNAQAMAARKIQDEQLNERLVQRVFVPVDIDKTIHLDDRALAALLRMEAAAQPQYAQLKALQCEIKDSHRRAIISHMQEMCMRENADLVVLPLAVSFMDRVLAVQFVPRRNIVALADASLFLAMKMKAPQPPKAHYIVDGCKRRLEELQDWELFIVNKLEWNLSTPTPFEFFDQLMTRAPILETLREAFANTHRIMLKDLQLACLRPSLQAAACLLYVADESRKAHLVRESEAAVRKCFGIEASRVRFQYMTNIRFALSDFFFDDDEEISNIAKVSIRPIDIERKCVTQNEKSMNSKIGNEIAESSEPDVLISSKETTSNLSEDNNIFQTTLICEESSLANMFDEEEIIQDTIDGEIEEMIIVPEISSDSSIDGITNIFEEPQTFFTSSSMTEDEKQESLGQKIHCDLPQKNFSYELDVLKEKEHSFNSYMHGCTKRPFSMPTDFDNVQHSICTVSKSTTFGDLNECVIDDCLTRRRLTSLTYSDDDVQTNDENSNSTTDGYSKIVASKPGNDSGFSTSSVTTPETMPYDLTTTTTTTIATDYVTNVSATSFSLLINS